MQYDEMAERIYKMRVIQEKLNREKFLLRLTGDLLDGEKFEYTETITARNDDSGFYNLAMCLRNLRSRVGRETFDSLQNRKALILNVGDDEPLLTINLTIIRRL